MRLDCQILLKSTPPKITGWIRPCLLLHFTNSRTWAVTCVTETTCLPLRHWKHFLPSRLPLESKQLSDISSQYVAVSRTSSWGSTQLLETATCQWLPQKMHIFHTVAFRGMIRFGERSLWNFVIFNFTSYVKAVSSWLCWNWSWVIKIDCLAMKKFTIFLPVCP